MHASKAFSNVDGASDPLALAAAMRNLSGLAWFQAVKRHMIDQLRVEPGHAVLDVGCGVGQDVLALAQLVGPTGRVVGVDSSGTMIDQARVGLSGGGAGLPVEFLVADAHTLPFADATFDRCHSERVLQHVADPQRVVTEMARVLRSGGRIALFDADWEMLVIDSPDRDLTRALLRHSCDDISAHPWVGRQLRRLVSLAGFVDIVSEPLTRVETDYALAGPQLRAMVE
jgi:ubiquinone/menaquinone biosynthesis C-methylase UbiE